MRFTKNRILVERGSFRPITNVTLDMLRCAQAQFVQEPKVQGEEVLTIMEMTLKNLTEGDKIDPQDFLDRVDILGALGKTVLISDFFEYYRLAAYFFRYTKKMIGIAMGVPSLREIFDEKYYTNLQGGILESFGRMFKNDLKLYVYPLRDAKTGSLISATNLRVAPNLRHLHAYLVENRFIEGSARLRRKLPANFLARCSEKNSQRRQIMGRHGSLRSSANHPRTKSVRLQRCVLMKKNVLPSFTRQSCALRETSASFRNRAELPRATRQHLILFLQDGISC